MDVVLFFAALLLVIVVLFWDAMMIIVCVSQVEINEDAEDGEFGCLFMWRGKPRYGYFFADKEPAPDQMFIVVGYDCTSDSWELEPYEKKVFINKKD